MSASWFCKKKPVNPSGRCFDTPARQHRVYGELVMTLPNNVHGYVVKTLPNNVCGDLVMDCILWSFALYYSGQLLNLLARCVSW